MLLYCKVLVVFILKFVLFFLDEKFRRMFKELFLLREVTKECCEDIKVTFLRRENADKTDETESTFLSTFHFPLRRLEELNEVEEYLQEPNHFQSTVCFHC